jgi:hypothetical protein
MSSGDRLLHVISARQEVSWSVFKKCVDTFIADADLSGVKAAPARTSLLRRLDALGHLDVLRTSATPRIVAAPSCLVRLPTDAPAAVFAGARPWNLPTLVSGAVNRLGLEMTINQQRGELAACIPDRVAVYASSDDLLEQCAQLLGVIYQPTPACWSCGHLSAGLDDVISALHWSSPAELQWQGSDFDVERATFRSRVGARPDQGLTRYLDPVKGTYRYWLWRDVTAADIDPDWGRYCAFRDAGRSVLHYDRNSQLLGVPRTAPLPRLLARALALCSGYSQSAPRRSPFTDQSALEVFPMVPRAVVDLVADKLRQDVAASRLDL